uniref:Uncharacterized protein n=1 Tax=Amphora coffeiformis TaxID=265554 RepID=A0A6S8IT85_9STRA|mmetsp:Transcript_26482/g.50009  ORF Transcript_26482/g.50009 Transcript_26482/m.50009 type:complete len:132 (+) Transcript_26482:262-657(+)|eukprot:scaffold2974_cov181-Amphora_coffeaeformis.AAC.17
MTSAYTYSDEDYERPDEWLGGGYSNKPIKKWKKPTVSAQEETISPCRPAGRHFHEDWLGGGVCPTTPTKRWQKPKPKVSPEPIHHRMHDEWLGSPSSYGDSPPKTKRPQQIKIEGMGSIKENPFFKNFSGL